MFKSPRYAITVLLIGSCTQHEVLLLEEDWRSESRLRRMDIVVEKLAEDTWTVDSTISEVGDIESSVTDHCESELAETPAFAGCFSAAQACPAAICEAQLELCRALAFRAMAETESEVVLVLAGSPIYRIKQQDPESRVALWQASQYASSLALGAVSNALFGTDCDLQLSSPFAIGADSLTQSNGELLASTLLEALENGELAAESGARAALGIADRDRAAISSLGAAAQLSWFDENLSRLVAVQSHVGGINQGDLATWNFHAGPYLHDDYGEYHRPSSITGELGIDDGIGVRPACTGPCAVARDTIRYSGAPFDQILEPSTSLDTLVTTHIGPRLSARAPGIYDATSAETLAASIGVPRAALLEARTWLRHEAEVFARPIGQAAPTPELPPGMDGTPGTTALVFDATTMARATPPPPMHYFTAARSANFWVGMSAVPSGDGETGSLRLPPLRPERAHLFAYAHAVAREALADATMPPEARGVLATLTQMASARRALDVEVCRHPDTTYANHARIRIAGLSTPPAAGDFFLVQGTTALRCAVDGVIEGVPCGPRFEQGAAGGFVPPTTNWAEVDPLSRDSRLRVVEWAYSLAATSTDPYLYIVRRRPDRSPGPGGYEPIAGIQSPIPTGLSAGSCVTVPYDYVSSELGSTTFAMYSDLAPAFECGDINLTGRVPLEDEIIDDGDPYEDSWQHHLQVAAAAASHADELGQRLIQSGLEMDMRAERGVDAVQEVCGVPVNIDGLFDEAGTLTQLVDDASCDEEIGDTCDDDAYECIGTQCVRRGVFGGTGESYDRTALLECLGLNEAGESDLIPVVALGGTELCVWHDVGAEQRLCGNAPPGSCPYPMPDDGACFQGTNYPAGFDPEDHVMLVINNDDEARPELLELIDPVDAGAGDYGESSAGVIRPRDYQCDNIRRMRDIHPSHTTRFHDYINRVTGPFFTISNVRYWAGRIGWRAYPLDFSEITVDGNPWIDADGNLLGTTGFPFTTGFGDRPHGIPGDTTAPDNWTGAEPWPCAPYPHTLHGAGLFRGALADCTDPADRAAWNRRMGRAAATLSALSGIGLSGVLMPAYYDGLPGAMPSRFNTATDFNSATWRIAGGATYGSHTLSGIVFAPLSTPSSNTWTGPVEIGDATRPVDATHPFAVLNFAHAITGGDTERADHIARHLWEGMQGGDFDNTGGVAGASGFFGGDFLFSTVTIGLEAFEFERSRLPFAHHTNNLFVRSLLRSDLDSVEYLNNRRNGLGQTNFQHLSGLFSQPAFDFDNVHANVAHLFANQDVAGFPGGAGITRGDLLDAMELMCQVADSLPAADVPPPEPPQPVIHTIADVGSVRVYAEQLARRIDDVAMRQIVQDVPAEVVRSVRGENGEQHAGGGTYGDTIERLKIELRRQGNAPRDIARALRAVSTALDVMAQRQHIFDNEVAKTVLETIVIGLATISGCISANSGAAGLAGSGVCVIQSVIGVLQTAIAGIALDSYAHEFAIEIQTLADGILDNFDIIEAKQDEMLNATAEVRRLLGELRSNRIAAQSALAGALFADSDAAGRHYPVNTAMRRVYDINLQRYRAAHRAAIQTAVVARLAVEQRFGVSLEEQNSACLVEPPSLWARDVCNASGVNYGEIRDPDVEIGEDAIRGMFIGDYVRRLERYTESYRFDFPYTSGDDLMVVSLRDDVVRARGACSEESVNLLGASNDLTAEVLPDSTGEVEAGAPVGWHVPAGGCDQDVSGLSVNCVAVHSVDGPRVATALGPPGPVAGRISSQPPRGYEVVFAPGTPSGTSDYTDGAAYVQDVALRTGMYRLSWYQLDAQEEGTVDARIAVASPSGSAVFAANERPMTNTWVRRFRFIEVPPTADGSVYHIGVFPEPMEGDPELHEQLFKVAGLQLEDVTGTVTAGAVLDNIVSAAADGPMLFAATTAPGWSRYEDCEHGDDSAFRRSWTYRCAELCAGGFGSDRCGEGEEPQTFCYWELIFNIDEERLLGRGNQFGGGFAFGNYNYRSGEIAVNVVGTGVRDCDDGSPSACYTTAGIPFSFSHGPPSYGGDPSAYTVRAHDGSLQPVHLFQGQIESGRALAAERYLTNPLSAADSSLLSDYARRELRGRPMTGVYRLILWDVPGFAFERVEDVQILWRYRYFTRTGSALMCEG